MKNDVMPSIVRVDPDVLKTLVAEVKETVASYMHIRTAKQKNFGTVDMWNIRKNVRSASARVRR